MWKFIKKWVPWLLLSAGCAFLFYSLGAGVFAYFKFNWAALTFPYPLDYGEGQLLDKTLLLAKFQSIYTSLPGVNQPPYSIANYPPVYPLVQVPFAWIFGPALWYGRLVNLISIVGAAVFCGLTIHTLTGSRLGGLITAAILLCFPYTTQWTAMVRVDSLALGLECAALYVIARYPHSRRGLILTAVLLAAAVYTRQSNIAASFAAFIWLLHEKPRRRAFQLAAYVAIPGILLFFVINLLTHGSFFFNLVSATVNRFSWDTVRYYFESMKLHFSLLLILGSGYILLGYWGRVQARAWWLVAPFLTAAAAVSITIGKSGSNINYLLEFSAALALVCGAVFAYPGKHRWISAVLAVLLALQVQNLTEWTQKDYTQWVLAKIANRAVIDRLAGYVHAAPGYVLADEYSGLIPLDSRVLYMMPFEFKQAVEAKTWDQAPMLDAIASHTFGLILIFAPPNWDSFGERWTPAEQDAIRTYYQPIDTLADTIVYVPK